MQFLSGYRANLKELGELCKSKGIIFCVDAIQAAGVVEIDVEKFKIDFLAGGSHKWLMALQGLGYIYITPGLMERLNPKYVGWLSVKNEWDLIKYKLELKETAARFHLGTNSVIGIFALAKSLELFEHFGIKNIEVKNLENTSYLIKKFNENEFDVIQKDFDKNNLAAITTLKFDKAEEIYQELKERNIIVSLREGMIRISPHFYNTKEDLDYLINQLKDIQRKINN